MIPRRVLTLGAVAAFTLVAAGCGSKQDILRPESHPARRIDHLWWIMMAGAWIGFGVAIPILVLTILFVYADVFVIGSTAAPRPSKTSMTVRELHAGERVKGGPVGAVE